MVLSSPNSRSQEDNAAEAATLVICPDKQSIGSLGEKADSWSCPEF
jgi:hypothetical protein